MKGSRGALVHRVAQQMREQEDSQEHLVDRTEEEKTQDEEHHVHRGLAPELFDYRMPAEEYSSPLRQVLTLHDWVRNHIVMTRLFEWGVMAAIALNCVVLALQQPRSDGRNDRFQQLSDVPKMIFFKVRWGLDTVLQRLDLAFTIVFCVEMTVKMVGLGFVRRRRIVENEESLEKIKTVLKAEQVEDLEEIDERVVCNDEMLDRNLTRKESFDAGAVGQLISVGKSAKIFTGQRLHEFTDWKSSRGKRLAHMKTEIVSATSILEEYNGYFIEMWNWLDFVIVVASLVVLINGSGSGLSGLRAFRVLRPLRNVSSIPRLRSVIEVFISSLSGLVDVMILLSFVLIVFGTMSVQLFNGRLHMQCFSEGYTDSDGNFVRITKDTVWDDLDSDIQSQITDHTLCKIEEPNAKKCIYSSDPELFTQCLQIGPNPDNGLTSFDHLGFALYQTFISTTLDNREVTGYLQDTFSTFVWTYTFLIIFLLSFFILNLVLAVITNAFDEDSKDSSNNKELQNIEEEREKQEKKLVSKEQERLRERMQRREEMEREKHRLSSVIVSGVDPVDQRNHTVQMEWLITLLKNARLDSFDTDNNKLVSRGEFVGFLSMVPRPITEKIFSDLDQSGDGTISPFEYMKWKQSLSKKYLKELVESTIFHLLDPVDEDGAGKHGSSASLVSAGMSPELVMVPNSGNRTVLPTPTNDGTLTPFDGKVSLEASLDIVEAAESGVPVIMDSDQPVSPNTQKHKAEEAALASNLADLANLDFEEEIAGRPTAKSFKEVQKEQQSRQEGRDEMVVDVSSAAERVERAASMGSFQDGGTVGSTTVGVSGGGGTTELEDVALNVSQAHKRLDTLTARSAVVSAGIDRAHSTHHSLRQDSLESQLTSGGTRRQDSYRGIDQFDKMLSQMSLKKSDTHKDFQQLVKKKFNGDVAATDLFEDYLHSYEDNSNLTEEYYQAKLEAMRAKKERETILQNTMDEYVITLLLKNTTVKRDDYLDDKGCFIKWCAWIVSNTYFSSFIMLTIFINSIAMSVSWPDMPDRLDNSMEFINEMCGFVFFIEFFLKHCGLGVVGYWKDHWNRFDGLIVIISAFDFVTSRAVPGVNQDGSSATGSVTALRAFRLFRVLRVLRIVAQMDSLKNLTEGVARSVSSVLWLLVLFMLFCFVFALLGLNFFAGRITESTYRWNFDNIWYSFLTVVQMVTVDSIRYVSGDLVGAFNSELCTVYFVILVTIGNFLLLNIFIAILLNNMAACPDKDYNNYRYLLPRAEYIQKEKAYWTTKEKHMFLLTELKAKRVRERRVIHNAVWAKHRKKTQLTGISFGMFYPNNSFRIKVFDLVHHEYFIWFINSAILASCIFLALDNVRLESTSLLKRLINQLNIVFAVIFTSEMFLKCMALGVTRTPYWSTRVIEHTESTEKDEAQMYDTFAILCKDLVNRLKSTARKGGLLANVDPTSLNAGVYQIVRVVPNPELIKKLDSNQGNSYHFPFQPHTIINSMMPGSEQENGHNNNNQNNNNSDNNGNPEDTNVHYTGLHRRIDRDVYFFVHYIYTAQRLSLRFVFCLQTQQNYRLKGVYVMDENRYYHWRAYANPIADYELHQIATSLKMDNVNRNAYLESNWNRLDCFVVFIGILSLVDQLKQLVFLRSLRAVRPLRIAARNKRIKRILSTLVHAVQPASNAILFGMVFMIILSIVGVQLMGGKMSFCMPRNEDGSDGDALGYFGFDDDIKYLNRTECESKMANRTIFNSTSNSTYLEEWNGYQWTTYPFNFDNVLNGFVTVYMVASADWWSAILWVSIDSADEIDGSMKRNNHPEYGLFYVLTLVLAGFFVLNLIVSVVIEEFNNVKNQNEQSSFKSEDQSQWIQMQRLQSRFRLKFQAKAPRNKIRAYCYFLTKDGHRYHEWFEQFITVCILVNCTQMALKHYQQSQFFNILEQVSDVLFTSIFFFEACIKITGLGWKYYWRDNWNRFDMLVLFCSIAGIIFREIDGLAEALGGVKAEVIKTSRMGRVFKLISKNERLNLLFRTFVFSLPSLWNVGITVFIVFYIFSVIGMNLFGDVDTTLRRFDFETFPSSIYTLFLSSTGDSWNVPFARCMVESNFYTAVAFWVTFFLINALVMINLFIGVVLESFEENRSDDQEAERLDSVKVLTRLWNAEDRKATNVISAHEFWRILLRSPFPAGFTQADKDDNVNEISEVPLMRFFQIAKSGRYQEPTMDEVRDKLSKIKLLVHRAYRETNDGPWILLDEHDAKVTSVLTKAVFSIFENDDAGMRADNEPLPDGDAGSRTSSPRGSTVGPSQVVVSSLDGGMTEEERLNAEQQIFTRVFSAAGSTTELTRDGSEGAIVVMENTQDVLDDEALRKQQELQEQRREMRVSVKRGSASFGIGSGLNLIKSLQFGGGGSHSHSNSGSEFEDDDDDEDHSGRKLIVGVEGESTPATTEGNGEVGGADEIPVSPMPEPFDAMATTRLHEGMTPILTSVDRSTPIEKGSPTPQPTSIIEMTPVHGGSGVTEVADEELTKKKHSAHAASIISNKRIDEATFKRDDGEEKTVVTHWVVKFEEVIAALCTLIMGHEPLNVKVDPKQEKNQQTLIEWWEANEAESYENALKSDGGVVGTEVSLFLLSLEALSKKYEKSNDDGDDEISRAKSRKFSRQTMTMDEEELKQSLKQDSLIQSAHA